MKTLALTFVLMSHYALGQFISPENRIVVLGAASTEIPADRVVFNIDLQFTDPTNIRTAYMKHKNAENKLLEFLKTNNIPNSNISYSLISVGKSFDYDAQQKRTTSLGTRQTVSVTLEDVKLYADFMMKLISAGFTEVDASFRSSQENAFKEILIQKAIEAAQKKAEVIAKAANRTINQILKVADTDESDSSFSTVNYAAVDLMKLPPPPGMIDIPQTISKNYSVKVVFELSPKQP